MGATERCSLMNAFAISFIQAWPARARWLLSTHWLRLGSILLLATALRFVNLDWDQGHAFHPDERAIAFAVERLSFVPLRLDPEFYAYGSLPFYVVRAATSALRQVKLGPVDDFALILLTGRALCALAGVLTVGLLFRVGSRLYGARVGALAALLLAACVLHIQHSHFMTSDVLLTLLVLASLERCLDIVQRGSVAEHAWAGAFVGLALATKVSAAPLLLPLVLAAFSRVRDGASVSSVARRLAIAGLALLAAGLAAEPYAALRFGEFSRQLAEQAAMVRHAGALPYTVQYIGTLPYLYPLEQMVLWGMGPALGLAAVWALIGKLRGLWRAFRVETMVLLAWVVSYLMITGAFEVKFIRYWLPAYPLLVLWAAEWAVRAADRGRRAPIRLIVGGTLLWAFAFLSVYRGPHTAVAASRWMYAHAPAGSRVLTQHWDEGFPLPLESDSPDRYRVVEFPYYEPDTPEKLQTLGSELAQSDYVVLPTARICGAVTRATARYPMTSAYFARLFAGELGFRLVHSERSPPRLFDLAFPDELADESFSVYDHPKVVVFENVERLAAEDLAARIGNPSRWPALSRAAILMAGRRPGAPIRSSAPALALFALACSALGMSAFGWLRFLLPGLSAWVTSRVLGVLLFAYLAWLLAWGLPGTFVQPVLCVLFVGFVSVGVFTWRRAPRAALPAGAFACEGIFWTIFTLFLLARASNPAIFWGEKPMDFAFLNALDRGEGVPPLEPWFSGSRLHYTYFGHFLVAALGKLCGLPPALTFNLAIAWIGAAAAAAAYGSGVILGGARGGLLAAAFTTLIGNLSGPIQLLLRKKADFDTFWATSRVIKDTINEYPVWSFLFADLHAHVLVLPISLTFLLLLVERKEPNQPSSRRWAVLGLTGLCLGAIGVTSAWSVPTYALLLVFFLGCAAFAEGDGRLLQRLFRGLGSSLVVLGTALVLFLPFWQGYERPELNWGWQAGTFVSLSDYLQIFGLFVYTGVSFLVYRALSRAGPRLRGPVLLGLFGLAVSLAFSLRFGLAGLGLVATILACSSSESRRHRSATSLLAFAFFVTAGCDVVYVWDRMNTIFKFYLDAWLLFALAGASAWPVLWRELPVGPLKNAWRALASLLCFAATITAATALYATFTTVRVETPRLSLDGIAYLALRDDAEARAVEWLNGHVTGSPTISEAWGEAYGDSARISMNTGLPTLLGWEYHVHQRAQPWDEIRIRKQDLEKLYRSADRAQAARILDTYAVDLVYAGGLERRTYGNHGVDRLAEWGDLLRPVYSNPGTTIYSVRSRPKAPYVTAVVEGSPPPRVAPPPIGQLNQARGLAVDAEGNVYAADFDNHRIQKWNRELQSVNAWGEQGSGKGQFSQPCEVAVRGDRLYVADTWNQRVQVFDHAGRYLLEWRAGFYGPRGLALGPEGTVYVADTGNHRISAFDADGAPVFAWGERGAGPGQFFEPMGLAVDTEGRVYVADNGNARVQIFDARGGFLSAFPVEGWRSEVYSEPKLALGSAGTIWLTVPLNGVVRSYTHDGRLTRELAGAPGLPHFSKPLGIAWDAARGEVLVTDLAAGLVSIPLQSTP
jgi:YYY domain-containing protein